jgi:hypothetical protein
MENENLLTIVQNQNGAENELRTFFVPISERGKVSTTRRRSTRKGSNR